MRLSRHFIPTLKETPAEAQIVSHQLMLRAGLVRQTAAGIYAWLPMGLRVMDRIAAIVREEQARAGALEVLMPTIQAADLWRESGRYDAYGPEMLRFADRHGREMLYSPTAEELFTRVMADGARSYRDLPRIIYQIQWKFRDEVRPRFGVMRGREFLMKDGYSFDLDEAGGRHSYQRMLLSYMRTFARMGLQAIPMRADTGPIGGDLSHEFIILAPSGESEVFFHRRWREARDTRVDADDAAALNLWVEGLFADYAATDEMRDEAAEARAGDALERSRGIEVGHIFFFGDKYTRALGMTVQGRDGAPVTPVMGSYGIGVSRLVGAAIEASHDAAGIVWPDAIAPYRVGILNLRADDAKCAAVCDDLHARFGGGTGADAGGDALLDDTDARGGEKFARMDLLGLPWQIIVGPKGVAAATVELKRRATGERHEVSAEDAVARILGSSAAA